MRDAGRNLRRLDLLTDHGGVNITRITRVNASFSIRSHLIRPERIAAMLPVIPDSTNVRGSDRVPPRPTPPRHGWFLELLFHDETTTLDQALADLLNRASPMLPHLAELHRLDPDLDIMTRVAIAPYDGRFPLFLERPTVYLLGQLGSSLDLEFVSMAMLEDIAP